MHNFSRGIFALAILVFIAFIAALTVGRYGVIPPSEILSALINSANISKAHRNILLMIRLPRTLAAFLVGSSLAVSGQVYQSTFSNKLVSPDILGVSSGCCAGAGMAMLCEMGTFGVSACAFLGGTIAVSAALFLPKLFRNRSSLSLVLSGIIVGAFMNSLISLMKYIADKNDKLSDLTYWMMGSLSGAKMNDVLVAAPIMSICMAVLLLNSWSIDIISLGREEALSLGTDYTSCRLVIIACSTLLTASSVSISGNIGWVGLVIPHISRALVGSRAKHCIPASILCGGGFMIFADMLIRIISVDEIPASVITGLSGALIYTVILVKKGRELDDRA